MNKFFGISAALVAFSIISGAFAAHGLKDKIDPYYLSVFEKAAYYNLTQALGLILVLIMAHTNVISQSTATKVFWTLLFGITVFSGSLYALALTQIKWLGAITPIGGAAMIIAWGLLAFTLIF